MSYIYIYIYDISSLRVNDLRLFVLLQVVSILTADGTSIHVIPSALMMIMI